jgi:hypothetical protein
MNAPDVALIVGGLLVLFVLLSDSKPTPTGTAVTTRATTQGPAGTLASTGGPSTGGPSTGGPTGGPTTGGPTTGGPSTGGPSTPGPSTPGPSTPGPAAVTSASSIPGAVLACAQADDALRVFRVTGPVSVSGIYSFESAGRWLRSKSAESTEERIVARDGKYEIGEHGSFGMGAGGAYTWRGVGDVTVECAARPARNERKRIKATRDGIVYYMRPMTLHGVELGDVWEETNAKTGTVYYASSGLPHAGGPIRPMMSEVMYTMGSFGVTYFAEENSRGSPIDIAVVDARNVWQEKRDSVFVVTATSQAQAAKIAGYYGILQDELTGNSGTMTFVSRGHVPSEESTLTVSENGTCAFAATGFECQLDETGSFDGSGVSVRCVVRNPSTRNTSVPLVVTIGTLTYTMRPLVGYSGVWKWNGGEIYVTENAYAHEGGPPLGFAGETTSVTMLIYGRQPDATVIYYAYMTNGVWTTHPNYSATQATVVVQ